MTGYTNDCLATVHVTESATWYMFTSAFNNGFGELHGSTDEGTSTVWSSAHGLRLLPGTDPAALMVEVAITTTTRRQHAWNEAKGTVVVRAPLTRVTFGEGGEARVAWALDFSNVPDANFRTDIDEPGFRPALLAALAPALRGAAPFVITPTVPTGMNPKIGVYGHKKKASAEALIAAVIFLLPGSTVPKIVEVTASSGAQLRLNKPILDLAIAGMLAEKGLNAPPERRFRDKPLTFLERMSVQLRENNVLATGRLRTEFIGIDHSIDVDLVLQAEATKGALAFRLIDSSVDSTSVLVDAAEFFGEGIIGRTLRDEVRATLDGAAAASIDPDALVGDLSAGPFTVFADGRVEHRADGIGIPFTVAGLSQRVATPPYARGHRLSREVHLPSGCRYGDAIADRSLRKFATPEQAIAAGYDGCASCLPALNNWDEGRAYVTASGPDDGTVPTVVLRIAPGAVRSGIPLDALEEPVPLRKTGQVRGIAVFGGTLKGLVPGEWDVDNRWGGHQHVQRVTISPVQRTDSTGAGTRLNYLRGEDRLIVDPTS